MDSLVAPTRVQQPGRDRLAPILTGVGLLQVLLQLGVILGRRVRAPVNRLPVLVAEALLEKLHLLALVEVAVPKQLKLLVQRCRARESMADLAHRVEQALGLALGQGRLLAYGLGARAALGALGALGRHC